MSLNMCQQGRRGDQAAPCCVVELILCPLSRSVSLTICLPVPQGRQRGDFWWQRQAALLQRESSFLGKWDGWRTPAAPLSLSLGRLPAFAASALTRDMCSSHRSCKCSNVTHPHSFFNTLHFELTVLCRCSWFHLIADFATITKYTQRWLSLI